jgi:hypothetical protein
VYVGSGGRAEGRGRGGGGRSARGTRGRFGGLVRWLGSVVRQGGGQVMDQRSIILGDK